MPNDYFRFKSFTVYQNLCAMKVGTDGVLLGAWANVERAVRVLDIGTGTGVVALMLAQRTAQGSGVDGAADDRAGVDRAQINPVEIDGVEVDMEAARQAQANFQRSPWSSCLRLIEASFQDFTRQILSQDVVCQSGVCLDVASQKKIGQVDGAGEINDANGTTSTHPVKYTHIVSNPPYFINSLKSDDQSRQVARHAQLLPYDDLAEGVARLLAPEGRFSAIFPYQEANVFIAIAAAKGLYCRRRLDVRGVPNKPVKRVLLEFRFQKGDTACDSLVIEQGERHNYSEKYKKLTADFYLKF